MFSKIRNGDEKSYLDLNFRGGFIVMTCQECNGTGQYVGLFKIEPCLSCNSSKQEKVVEQKSTMLVVQSGPNKGTKVWVLNPEELDVHNFDWDKAKVHRDNDLPAVEYPNGVKFWYKNDEFHRDNDLPAIEWPNRAKEWWVNGGRHRDNDLPAVERSDGTKQWWINGKLHRDNDLPAIEFSKGTKQWYVNDKLHRDNDLPAVEDSDGTKQWWVNGKCVKVKI